MKFYEDCSQSPDGWNITSTLKLDDDGRFCFDETWTDYTNATIGVTVDGSWRREAGAVILHPLRVEGTLDSWLVGRERKGVERDDTLDFGGRLTLRALPEREQDVAEPEYQRFEPRTPSPELAALIRRWVDALPTEGMQNWVGRLCKQHDSIPLHSTQIYLWALRPDGQVLSIDHESFARRAELENDPVTAYAALAQGARVHPELGELLAHNPAGVRQCEVCGGQGWTEAQPPAQGTDSCQSCYGMGWYAPRTPR